MLGKINFHPKVNLLLVGVTTKTVPPEFELSGMTVQLINDKHSKIEDGFEKYLMDIDEKTDQLKTTERILSKLLSKQWN